MSIMLPWLPYLIMYTIYHIHVLQMFSFIILENVECFIQTSTPSSAGLSDSEFCHLIINLITMILSSREARNSVNN